MRRLAAPLIVLALLLAGCSGSDDPSPSASSTTAAASNSLDQVTVEGEAGEEPTIDVPVPFVLTEDAARVISPGTGEELQEGQLVSVHLTAVSGDDGSSQGSTYASTPAAYLLTEDGGLPAAVVDLLIGQKVGVRVVAAGPRQFDEETTTTMIWTFEVTTTDYVLSGPSGADVTPAGGLPTVTLAEDGEPSITPVDTEAPAELVVQPLITGNGTEVTESSTVVANYSGWLWDGTAFDSSWSRGTPSSFSLTQVIEGWQQGLTGQTVGSQVLLIIPADLGYGDTESGSIPAGSTLIFVVDILAAA